jgi:hypothetical protein
LNRAAASEQDAGMGILVEPMTMADLADVLAAHAQFWVTGRAAP